MNARASRDRRRFVAASKLAKDTHAPEPERAAARALADRLLDKHPEFKRIRVDRELPPRSLRSFEDHEVRVAMATIKKFTGDGIEPRDAGEALAAYRAVSETYDLPWNAVCEAVVEISNTVLRAVDAQRAAGGNSAFAPPPDDDDFDEAPPAPPPLDPQDDEAPARPDEDAPERPEEPPQAPDPDCDGVNDEATLFSPPKMLHETDPRDLAHPHGDPARRRPRYAWPGWPSPRRDRPYDGSWWNPYLGLYGGWDEPGVDLSRGLRAIAGAQARSAEWMPVALWVTACTMAGRRHNDFDGDAAHRATDAVRLPAPGRCVGALDDGTQCRAQLSILHDLVSGHRFCIDHLIALQVPLQFGA